MERKQKQHAEISIEEKKDFQQDAKKKSFDDRGEKIGLGDTSMEVQEESDMLLQQTSSVSKRTLISYIFYLLLLILQFCFHCYLIWTNFLRKWNQTFMLLFSLLTNLSHLSEKDYVKDKAQLLGRVPTHILLTFSDDFMSPSQKRTKLSPFSSMLSQAPAESSSQWNDDLKKVSRILCWAFLCGVEHVSLYSLSGGIRRHRDDLEKALNNELATFFGQKEAAEYIVQIGKGIDEKSGQSSDQLANFSSVPFIQHHQNCFVGKKRFVSLLDFSHGRPLMAKVALNYCKAVAEKKMKADDLTEDLISLNVAHQLSLSTGIKRSVKQPSSPANSSKYFAEWEPEIVVNLDDSCVSAGFCPWSLRLSEIFHGGAFRDFNSLDFLSILATYSKTVFRYGK